MIFANRSSRGRLTGSMVIAYVLLCDLSLINGASPIIRGPWDIDDGNVPEGQASDAIHYNVVRLNRHVFAENVQRAEPPATAEHWFVFFCADWFEPCQALLPRFMESGERWEDQLNEGQLLTRHVRFARVDCAVDKPLCNTEGVEAYPTIVHYTQGRSVAEWRANGRKDEKRLEKWLDRELADDTSKVPTHTAPSAAELAGRVSPLEYVANFTMVLVLAALNFWVIRQQVDADSMDAKRVAAALVPKPLIPGSISGIARCFPPAWVRERVGGLEL